ncbi:MAG: hypothetical protein ACR2GU_15200 [Rubrobacteraceae bacterium]
MSVFALYLLSFFLGVTYVFFAYQRRRGRTVLMACSPGLPWSMFLIFLVILVMSSAL